MTLNDLLKIKQHVLYRCKFIATQIFIQDIRILFLITNFIIAILSSVWGYVVPFNKNQILQICRILTVFSKTVYVSAVYL